MVLKYIKPSERLKLTTTTKQGPLIIAKKHLSFEEFEEFQIAHDYLFKISKKRREIRKKAGTKTSSYYNDMVSFTKKYFGEKGEFLTEEAKTNIKELIQRVVTHVKKKTNREGL